MAENAHPKTGTPQKRVGSVVRGKYRIEAFLATGTMANVYAATHRNGARVALKILHKQLAEDPALCERFKREGYFANSIGHPGIVRAIDDDVTEDGCPFLVMELLEGETLDERRRRKGGKLSLRWVLPVADSLLEVLATAHAREVVHRDLKPDNVFVTNRGEVKVLDFGVARWADGKDSSDMTAVGMVLGTPAYMPPEQALGRREDVDAQSDLWAVGATLFVVLSGESVHEGGDARAKLIATARTAARPLREAAPDVPRAVAQVIDRALAFHKQERWPDATAMREALRWARLSLENRPSHAGAHATSELQLEAIPPPVETRRFDDEPTLARAFPSAFPGSGARPHSARPHESSIPGSKDFLTSAPPITLRDVPKSTSAEPTEPIFSLRREKDGERSPSTERLPTTEPLGGGPNPRPEQHAWEPAQSHAPTMPAIDPAEMLAELASSSANIATAVDVNLTFTRPMAAMVMPMGYDGPRPAAGTQLAHDVPAFPAVAPYPSAAPPPYVSSPPPAMMHQASSHPSGAPDAPGPLLAEIVKPARGRALRIVVPLALVLISLVAAALALRARAANARSGTATGIVATAPAASSAATPEPAIGVSTTTPAAPVAPTATEAKKPKPRPKKKPSVKPPVTEPASGEPASPVTTATATAREPAAPPPPADTTPRDSLPAKDPAPESLAP